MGGTGREIDPDGVEPDSTGRVDQCDRLRKGGARAYGSLPVGLESRHADVQPVEAQFTEVREIPLIDCAGYHVDSVVVIPLSAQREVVGQRRHQSCDLSNAESLRRAAGDT